MLRWIADTDDQICGEEGLVEKPREDHVLFQGIRKRQLPPLSPMHMHAVLGAVPTLHSLSERNVGEIRTVHMDLMTTARKLPSLMLQNHFTATNAGRVEISVEPDQHRSVLEGIGLLSVTDFLLFCASNKRG
jgi:hypothetical protein